MLQVRITFLSFCQMITAVKRIAVSDENNKNQNKSVLRLFNSIFKVIIYIFCVLKLSDYYIVMYDYSNSKKSPLYRNHSFVVNLGLLHLWKFKLASDDGLQFR
jgi:hypothetical protein